jgi:hypothetical protein
VSASIKGHCEEATFEKFRSSLVNHLYPVFTNLTNQYYTSCDCLVYRRKGAKPKVGVKPGRNGAGKSKPKAKGRKDSITEEKRKKNLEKNRYVVN